MGVFHTLYTVQIIDKYENVLNDMCWNDTYLILDLEDQYMENYNNKSAHISNDEINVGMVDIHTLYPIPYQLMLRIYDTHVASYVLYIYQIGN